ncbi:hypothetical protein [Alkalihalobacillus sp. CinArs1]|uniref:hypothetical protein n=1 Tax=Alkalihalobacillus sp. CinArs1 TaxID=2995314 RepID=UPI0022DD9350|nr:hypothetical protein [Alkalihalobacillus sp. CinArs1]
MKGLIMTGVLIVALVFTGMIKQHHINTPPYVSDHDDIGVMSGYHHIHVVMDDGQFNRLDVYNKEKERTASYSSEDIDDLFPAGEFIEIVEEKERVYARYITSDRDAMKKLVVGARGKLQFAHERN